jgi:cytochrome c556
MKKTALLSLFLGVSAIGWAQDDEALKGWMKATAGAVGSIKKNLEAKSNDAVVTDAKKLEGLFANGAEYWTKKNVNDAAGWSKEAQTAAGKVAIAAAAGDTDGATAALKGVTGSCKGCHEAHRDKLADGSYKIK